MSTNRLTIMMIKTVLLFCFWMGSQRSVLIIILFCWNLKPFDKIVFSDILLRFMIVIRLMNLFKTLLVVLLSFNVETITCQASLLKIIRASSVISMLWKIVEWRFLSYELRIIFRRRLIGISVDTIKTLIELLRLFRLVKGNFLKWKTILF